MRKLFAKRILPIMAVICLLVTMLSCLCSVAFATDRFTLYDTSTGYTGTLKYMHKNDNYYQDGLLYTLSSTKDTYNRTFFYYGDDITFASTPRGTTVTWNDANGDQVKSITFDWSLNAGIRNGTSGGYWVSVAYWQPTDSDTKGPSNNGTAILPTAAAKISSTTGFDGLSFVASNFSSSSSGSTWTAEKIFEEPRFVAPNATYYAEANAIITKINAIPDLESITADDADVIQEARAAYDAKLNTYSTTYSGKYAAAYEDMINLSTTNTLVITSGAYDYLVEAEDALLHLGSGDQDAADAVAAQIDALPSVADAQLTNADAIAAANTAYNALDDLTKELVAAEKVTKLNELVAEMATLNDVVTKIAAIPDTITYFNGQTETTAASTAYNALTDAQKAKIPTADVTKLNAAVASLESVSAPAEHVFTYNSNGTTLADHFTDSNSNPIMVGDLVKVDLSYNQSLAWSDLTVSYSYGNWFVNGSSSKLLFDGVNSADKSKLIHSSSGNYSPWYDTSDRATWGIGYILVSTAGTYTLKANDSATTIFTFTVYAQEDVNAAAAVTAQIAALTSSSSASDVSAARSAYTALTDSQKALVTNLSTLEALEEAMAETLAGQVTTRINELTFYSTSADIADVRAAYDALTDTAKALVKNASKLDELDSKFFSSETVDIKLISKTADNGAFFEVPTKDIYVGDTVWLKKADGTKFEWSDLTSGWSLSDGTTFTVGSVATAEKSWENNFQIHSKGLVVPASFANKDLTIYVANSDVALVTFHVYDKPDQAAIDKALDINAQSAVNSFTDVVDAKYTVVTATEGTKKFINTESEYTLDYTNVDTAYAALIAETPADYTEALRVKGLIESLNKEITLANEEEVNTVSAAYDNLTDNQLKYFVIEGGSTEYLTKALNTISTIKSTLYVVTIPGTNYKLNNEVQSGYVGYHAAGDQLTLEYTGTNTFVGWFVDGRIVSESTTYTLNVSASVEVLAWEYVVNSSKPYVVVVDGFGKNIFSQYVETASIDTKLAELSTPTRYGSVFKEWSKQTSEDGSYVYVTPVFEAASENASFTVSFSGDYASYASAVYSDTTPKAATVSVTGAPEGMKFECWKDSDGNVVSYAAEYKFYLSGNTTLVPSFVSTDTEVVATSILTIEAKPISESNKIAFHATRSIAEGNTVIGYGIIVTKNADRKNNLTVKSVDDYDDVICGKGRTDSNGKIANDGLLIINKANAGTDTWYARAYVVYTDAAGDTHTIYSDVVEASLA